MFEDKYNELRAKADRISNLGRVYETLEDRMKWDALKYHDKDETHEEVWWTDPEPDDYNYELFLAYKEVLEAIEKLANK